VIVEKMTGRGLTTRLKESDNLLVEVIDLPHPHSIKIGKKKMVSIRVECKRIGDGAYYELSAFAKESRRVDVNHKKRIYGPIQLSEKEYERSFRDLAWSFKRMHLRQTTE
jgi:hypothetical protein